MKVTGFKFLSANGGLRLFCFLILVSASFSALAQVESPYSRYGLGTLRSPVFSANKGMGYLAAPYNSIMNINAANPASYASLAFTTIEVGALIDGSNIVTNDSSYRAGAGNVNHFAIAFVPIPKKAAWAITIGLMPYSNVKYNFVKSYNDTLLGGYNQVFTGNGSLYHAFVGGAFKISGFSFGANLGYVFGKTEYQRIIAYSDSIQAYDTRNFTGLNMGGFYYTVGVQYQKLIRHKEDDVERRHDIWVTIGAYGSGGNKLNAAKSVFWDRLYYNSSGGGLLGYDTISAVFNEKSKINLPVNMGAGIMFGNEAFWQVGVDFKYANWQSFTTPLDNGGLANSWQVAFGAQILPKDGDRNYFNRMNYRVGAYYGQSEITYQGSNLSEGGATFGLGFPFKPILGGKLFGHLNVAGDFGTRGSSDKTAIRENYYRFTLGLVINNAWFIPRKFD